MTLILFVPQRKLICDGIFCYSFDLIVTLTFSRGTVPGWYSGTWPWLRTRRRLIWLSSTPSLHRHRQRRQISNIAHGNGGTHRGDFACQERVCQLSRRGGRIDTAEKTDEPLRAVQGATSTPPRTPHELQTVSLNRPFYRLGWDF
jgi:hypothetical protein